MICQDCYLEPVCEKLPDDNGRCSFYVKRSKVEISEDLDVNPMDTTTFDYDDLKELFEDTRLNDDPLKELGLHGKHHH
ncbi:MAG: hypothetical protein HKO68_07080 [Desulfobacterales bacterium]|nr:hypothetical protein [Deltaproteobacteria bacterium]NNL76082.1 hypothetical protein [Desulfobacterales bacterium]